jgi:hypothetical protein
MVGSVNNGFQQPPLKNISSPSQELKRQGTEALRGGGDSPADQIRQSRKVDITRTNKSAPLVQFTQDSGKISASSNRGTKLDISV